MYINQITSSIIIYNFYSHTITFIIFHYFITFKYGVAGELYPNTGVVHDPPSKYIGVYDAEALITGAGWFDRVRETSGCCMILRKLKL